MLVSIFAGIAIWFGMGALIVTQRIPAFIITLAGLLVFKGLHWKVIPERDDSGHARRR